MITDKIVTVLTEQAKDFRRESLEVSGRRKKFAAVVGKKLLKSSRKNQDKNTDVATHQMIDENDRFQRTPLHLAVKYNKIEVAKLLCSK